MTEIRARPVEPNAEIGQRIAKAREFLGLTQAVIAEKLGLARTTQVAIEQGRRPVSVAELYRYAEVLSRPAGSHTADPMASRCGWRRSDNCRHDRDRARRHTRAYCPY